MRIGRFSHYGSDVPERDSEQEFLAAHVDDPRERFYRVQRSIAYAQAQNKAAFENYANARRKR